MAFFFGSSAAAAALVPAAAAAPPGARAPASAPEAAAAGGLSFGGGGASSAAPALSAPALPAPVAALGAAAGGAPPSAAATFGFGAAASPAGGGAARPPAPASTPAPAAEGATFNFGSGAALAPPPATARHRQSTFVVSTTAIMSRLLFLVLLAAPNCTPKALALLPPAPPPPTHHSTARTIPSPPPDAAPFVPSPVDNVLLAAFRWTLQQQSGVRSSTRGFDGMMDELMNTRRSDPEELERISYQTMVALAGPVPAIYRTLFASSDMSPAVLAWFAKHLLPFLVGHMTLTQRDVNDDRGGGVLVERCRVLEGSGCKGVCAKMCKVPTERFFAERWGVPLTMRPNFETGQCQLTFGVEPVPIGDDLTIPPGCLGRCPAALVGDDMVDPC